MRRSKRNTHVCVNCNHLRYQHGERLACEVTGCGCLRLLVLVAGRRRP